MKPQMNADAVLSPSRSSPGRRINADNKPRNAIRQGITRKVREPLAVAIFGPPSPPSLHCRVINGFSLVELVYSVAEKYWPRQVKKRLEKRLHLVYRITNFVLRIRTSAKSVANEVDSCLRRNDKTVSSVESADEIYID